MKYIDAEKLIAEIYKCREDALSVMDIDKANNLIEVIELIEDLQQEQPLTTEKVIEQCKKFGGNPEVIYQEQPEVDLEKELEQWRHEHFRGKRDGDYSGEYLERESQLDLARHFWNKGFNARKEE
jgi:hypothetical protein